MKVAEVRRLVQEHSLENLIEAANIFENERTNKLQVQGQDDNEIMSHLLAASFVRELMDEKGLALNEAVREYSKRVRAILS